MAKSLVIKRRDSASNAPTDIYIDGNLIEDVISYELTANTTTQLTLTIFIEAAEVHI